MMKPDNFAVSPGSPGLRAFDDELIADVSSHDRRLSPTMSSYPTCHARRPAAWDGEPESVADTVIAGLCRVWVVKACDFVFLVRWFGIRFAS
ncbi:hypothetical protein SAZ11_04195 [Streptomyces sp. FXJ1.4098]|uniref:hypothetical protein n=1 Tax=Streptomyces sp. NPDC020845 TaxID=3365096 RepID=UPI002990F20B|nr:hypothetical protein [Streptomyces sp. FXJ1.4098]